MATTVTMTKDQKMRSIAVLREIITLTGSSSLTDMITAGTVNLTVSGGVITKAVVNQTGSRNQFTAG